MRLIVATRAYKQAVHTLSALSSHPSPYQALSSASNSKSILSSVLPNLQGPIGSAIRIANRIQQQVFNILMGGGKLSGMRRREEEMYRKSIKVVDLLQHSAELGNMDALYMLGQISMVCVQIAHLLFAKKWSVSAYFTLPLGPTTLLRHLQVARGTDR